jgi:formylglycine-generating enzyme required for sulfatase activity
MAQGERAETESRWEDALASFEEALRAKPGDSQSEEAARRVRARLEEVRARDRAARQAEERRLLCEEFSQKAEEAEKAKVRGKTGDLDAAMAFWRKARELADDPEKIRAVDARIEALAGPVFRKALLDARAAEARKDWIAADQACIRAAAARPEDRTVGPLRARVAERLQEISKLVGAFMMFPPDDRDRFGNPVASRGGSLSDPETGLPYEIWLREPRIEFVLVPTGRFKMGSPKTEPGHRPEEAPPMNIHMAQPYYIGKYEATQADWKALLAPMESGLRGEDLPVENVSWHDAKKFAGELNRKAGAAEDAPPYFALPTEAEWEYAARAGSQTPFHSGAVEKDLAAAAWFVRNAEGRTHPVGKREPNAWGLYDAHGNVWEWCLDYFSDSLARRFAEAPDDAKRAGRVLRGGSFGASAEDCRCARRHSADPGDKRPDTGFRLCLKLYPPPKDLPEKK